MKKLLFVLLLLVACGGQPINPTYSDSVICYSTNGNVIFSEEAVEIVSYASTYIVHYENGQTKEIPVDGCFVTHGE